MAPGDQFGSGVTGSWTDAPAPEPLVAVVDPDGVRGKIPVSQLHAAGAKGYRASMWDANGMRGSVPVEQMAAATRAGYTTTPKTQFEQERNPAKQPGFFRSALNTLENQAEGVVGASVQPWKDATAAYEAERAKGGGVLKSAGMGVVGAATMPAVREAQQVVNAPSAYRARRALGYNPVYSAIAPAVAPAVGIDLPAMEHSAEIGNERGVVAGAAVPAAEIAAGEANRIPAVSRVTRAIGEIPGKAIEKAGDVPGLRLSAPKAPKALHQAIQPGVNIPRAAESIEIAGPRLQQVRQEAGLEFKSPADLLEGVKLAKQKVYDAIEQRLGPVAQLQADTSPVADAMEKSISGRTQRQFPQAAKAIKDRAATYRGNLSLRDIENSIQDANNDLRNFYKQPATHDSPIAPQTAATEAEVKALRSLLDQKVEQLSGKGIAPLKREYGALRDVERATARQHAVETRTKGARLWEGLAALRAAGDFMSGNALGAAKGAATIALGRRMQVLRDPNFLIDQAFQGSRAFKPAAEIERAEGPQISGLLSSGPTITPPPPDTSGSIHIPVQPADVVRPRALGPAPGEGLARIPGRSYLSSRPVPAPRSSLPIPGERGPEGVGGPRTTPPPFEMGAPEEGGAAHPKALSGAGMKLSRRPAPRAGGRTAMTREIANAAATDEGNRSMREGGRTKWNQTDYNAAASVYRKLWKETGPLFPPKK